jgi:hypothetical protein
MRNQSRYLIAMSCVLLNEAIDLYLYGRTTVRHLINLEPRRNNEPHLARPLGGRKHMEVGGALTNKPSPVASYWEPLPATQSVSSQWWRSA